MTIPTGPSPPGAGEYSTPPADSGERLAVSPDQQITNLLLESFPPDHEIGESGVVNINVTDPPDFARGAHPDNVVNAQLTKWQDQETLTLDRLEVDSTERTPEGQVRTNIMVYPDSSGQLQLRKRVDRPGGKQDDDPRPVTTDSIEGDLAEIKQGMKPWLSESSSQGSESATAQA